MQKSILSLLVVLIGSTLFSIIFWQEKQGLNILLFDVFIIAALWYLDKEPFSTPSVKAFVAGTLLTSILIVWHNSFLAMFIHALSFATMIGLVQQRELRFLGYAFLMYGFNLLSVPLQFVKTLKSSNILRGYPNVAQRLGSVWMVVLIVPVFYLIYYAANAKFAELANRFWHQFFWFFTFDINLARIILFVFGFVIIGAAIWRQSWVDLQQIDQKHSETLNPSDEGETDTLTYRNAFNLIVMLNALLLINNVLDIRYVWFGDVSGKTALELKEYVHEGTYVLIFGIILAIAVILWLFRGSLNFIKNEGELTTKSGQILRGATSLWLAQNALLALSVGVRNTQYIQHYGLAYKRIGVFIFLSLALYGLWLLFLKIREKRTFFFFMRRGAYAIYAVLVAACLVNWDVFITNYNIHTPAKSGSIDVRFLVEDVSDKNLPQLFTNIEFLAPKMPQQPFPDSDYRGGNKVFATDEERLAYLKGLLIKKKEVFEREQKNYSWFSWNYPDYVNRQFFK
ncbi:MAG: DUF4173 domain-containing protein [Saprospiraceae bacterium]|nr:DUF4173 domain-containing protein [Saprospiraceae bacterium]